MILVRCLGCETRTRLTRAEGDAEMGVARTPVFPIPKAESWDRTREPG